MMKISMMFLLCLVLSAFAEEDRVYAYYLPDSDDFLKSMREIHGIFHKMDQFVEPTAIAKPPFKSRFFEEPGQLWDYTAMLKAISRFRLTEGRTIYHEPSQRLVFKGSRDAHHRVQDFIKRRSGVQTELKLTVYQVNGVSFERMTRLPAGVKELTSLSVRLRDNEQAVVVSSDKVWELTALAWQDYRGFWEYPVSCSFTLSGKHEGLPFSFEQSVVLNTGLSKVVDLGSHDGKTSMIAELHVERVLPNGKSFDFWALDEVEGNFLERRKIKEHKPLPAAPDGYVVMRMPAFIWGAEWQSLPWKKKLGGGAIPFPYSTEDPAFGGGTWNDFSNLEPRLYELGLLSGEDVECFFRYSNAAFYTNAAGKELEHLRSFFRKATESSPCSFEVSVIEVESDQRLNRDVLDQQDFGIVRKLEVELLDAIPREVKLGQQINGYFEMCRDQESKDLVLSFAVGKGREDSKSISSMRLKVEDGVPIILRQEKVDGKWKALVLRASRLNWLGERLK